MPQLHEFVPVLAQVTVIGIVAGLVVAAWLGRRENLVTEGVAMLVLSRKVGEKILIGEGPTAITLVVVEIDRNKIKLGVQAPLSVPVYRAELLAPGQQNGRPIRLGKMAPVALQAAKDNGCGVCHNPNCREPGGKH